MKKIIINSVMILLIFVILCLIIFGLYRRDDDNSLTTVKVAEVAHSIFYAPQYAAIANGYFEEEGINIDLSLANGADKVTAAVLSGDVDIGFCGSEATIYIYNGGEEDYLKTFAQLTQKDGSFIVAREKNDNFSLEDLRGKYIIGGREGACYFSDNFDN